MNAYSVFEGRKWVDVFTDLDNARDCVIEGMKMGRA